MSFGLALMACGISPVAGRPATPMPTHGDTLTVETSHWVVHPPDCQFVAGGYQVTAIACFSEYEADQGTAAVDVQVARAEQFALVGLALRRAGAGNYYVFGLTLDGDAFDGGWAFARLVNGQGAVIASGGDPAIRRGSGAANTLRVDFAGKQFTFRVNDARVGQAEDATFSGMGLLGLSAGGGSSAVFTNFAFSCAGTCISPGALSPARPQVGARSGPMPV